MHACCFEISYSRHPTPSTSMLPRLNDRFVRVNLDSLVPCIGIYCSFHAHARQQAIFWNRMLWTWRHLILYIRHTLVWTEACWHLLWYGAGSCVKLQGPDKFHTSRGIGTSHSLPIEVRDHQEYGDACISLCRLGAAIRPQGFPLKPVVTGIASVISKVSIR